MSDSMEWSKIIFTRFFNSVTSSRRRLFSCARVSLFVTVAEVSEDTLVNAVDTDAVSAKPSVMDVAAGVVGTDSLVDAFIGDAGDLLLGVLVVADVLAEIAG